MHVERSDAKILLRALSDPQALACNPLLLGFVEASHEERRAAVLRALEQLHPGAATAPEAHRRRRKHAMLLRCDVHGEAHETVASDLGVSIRQFYRERNEALEDFVHAIKASKASALPAVRVDTDAFAMRERFLQKLRACGQHDRVFREAAGFAAQLGQNERAIEFWTVAAEAARYMGDLVKSQFAIDSAKRLRSTIPLQRPIGAGILIAISEIALDWASGRYIDASNRIEREMRDCGFGRALAGLDATLFAIMLTYGVSVEIERGRWGNARAALRHLEETTNRIDLSHTSPSLRRHAGRFALRAERDRTRAIIELRESLAVAQRFDNLAVEASAATELGIAYAENAPGEAHRYIEYGLSIGRHVLGQSEFAMLALEALPALLRSDRPEHAAQLIEELRTLRLSERAKPALDLGETALLLHKGAFRKVLERAEPLAAMFDSRGVVSSAAEATLMSAKAYAALGRHPRARRLQRDAADLLGSNLAVAQF